MNEGDNMNIETVVSALNYDFDNISNQNFRDKVLIVNQSEECSEVQLSSDIKVINSKTRGIGISRKLGLKNATGEIIVLTDDDVVFDDDYTSIVEKAYDRFPKADMIMFNVRRKGDDRRESFIMEKSIKLNYLNSLKFGAVNITFRLSSVCDNEVTFDENFGKSPFVFGEDSIFIYDALKKGLDLYYVNDDIGEVDLSESSWFNGYDENYFVAKGAQFYRLSKYWCYLLMFQFLLRKKKIYKNDIGSLAALSQMLKGKKQYKEKVKFNER